MEAHEIEQRLWDYIDGTCLPEERAAIDLKLSTDTAWQGKYIALLDIHTLLSRQEAEQPSMRFTKNVMDSVMALTPPVQSLWATYISKWFTGIMSAVFVLPLVIVLCSIAVLFINNSGSGNGKVHQLLASVNISSEAATYIAWFTILPVLLLADVLFRYRRKAQTNK